MTTLYLARHGETQWNLARRMQGRGDSALTDRGRRQATRLAERLRNLPFEAIYSSSSGRAMATAEILRGPRAIPLLAEDDLREMHLGCWEGLEYDRCEELYPQAYRTFWTRPQEFEPMGGESFPQLRQRLLAVVDRIRQAHPAGGVLVVSHACAVTMLMSHFAGRPLERLWEPPRIHPASLSIVHLDGSVPRIELYGDTSHYDEDCRPPGHAVVWKLADAAKPPAGEP